MDSVQIAKISALVDSYENQIAHYNFKNNELFELKRTEKEIENLIKPLLNNEELLLKMIKTHWSIIRFVKEDRAFFIKACTINPECGREARNLELLIQLYKINPDITKYAPPYYQNELAEYLKKNPQGIDEHSTGMSSIIEESPETHISQMSIYDYLVLCEDARPRYKLVGMITNKQFVTSIANGDLGDHTSMFEKMFQSVFSHGKYSINKMPNDIIAFYSTGEDFIINIPDKISFQQYQVLLDIINQVKQFEADYDMKLDLFDPDGILKEAQSKLSQSYQIESDEIIVGKPIAEQLLIDSINRELDIENCKDANGLRKIASIISKYYNDSYFKNIILKIVPNAEQIIAINKNLSAWAFSYPLEEIPISIENLSYENVQNYLQYLLSAIEQKKEAEDYDKMYNEALNDNQEFDRKRAEEDELMRQAYENVSNAEKGQHFETNEPTLSENDEPSEEETNMFSAMYEQALKDNEEFDRRKEEEKYQSLLDKEAQLRQEWKNNITEESYYNYKNAIKARLESEKQNESAKQSTVDDYEAKKQEYEEVSTSKKLVDSVTSKSSEEIDSDLDDFEAEERKILNSKHFTDDQKKQMIEQLYSEFDKYAEENPELSGRQI